MSHLFSACAQELTRHPFLACNPVMERVKGGSLSADKLRDVIRQYVRLPEEIVGFLQMTASHFSSESGVFQELTRNWKQEKGSSTGGVPHVDILKYLLKRDVDIEADHVTGSLATEQFITTVREGMKRNAWLALGQAYALEASALPELAVLVGPVLNAYARMIGVAEPIKKIALKENGTYDFPRVNSPEDALGMSMSDWFAMHIIDFEVGHRDFLGEEARKALLAGGNSEMFRQGYTSVLDAMDTWWASLAVS